MGQENKIIHYSRNGYNGDYTYTSVCGKEVKTHQDSETSSIHETEANCEECMSNEKYQTDLKAFTDLKSDTKRRIYIESDILKANEFSDAKREVKHLLSYEMLTYVERVFSDVLDFAWHDLEGTWNAVKIADEIYTTSSLMPLVGNSYMGAPVIFNGMCERAVKEKINGKKVIILNSLENIEWDMIDIPMMKKAFKKNDLYAYDDEYELIKVDITKLKNKS